MGTATVAGSIKPNKITFDYREVKKSDSGGGPRGIEIRAAGSPHGYVEFFPVAPNPHGSAQYNRNSSGFYKALATDLARSIRVEEAQETFNRLKESDRPPTIENTRWQGMSKAQQKAAVKKYNDDKQTELDDRNRSAFHREVDRLLKQRHRSSCTWEGVTYTVP